MFKMDLSSSYTWPVDVMIPDNGKTKTMRFDARFARLSQPEIDSLMSQASSGDVDDIEFCNQVLEGWKGIQDEDGNDFDYSESNKQTLLEVYPVAACIVGAYGKSITDGRIKN